MPPAAFEDAAYRAGVRFTHVNGEGGDKYFPVIMGSGCAFLDYDRDGKLDIYLVNGAPMPHYKGDPHPTGHLYHNNGDGTFTDRTRGSGLEQTFFGMGCAVGDYDNDGYDDLYVTAALSPSRLFHNNHNGTFTDVARAAGVGNHGAWGTSCAWLDYDLDGKLDLFVCNYVKYRTLKDNIPCMFRPGIVSYCIPRAYEGEPCVLYHNLGRGRFEDVTKKAGIYSPLGKSLGIAVWDVNGDGYPDIFVSNDGAPNFLYTSNPNGTFTDVASERGTAYGDTGAIRAGMGIDVGDELHNGKTTMLVTNFSSEMVGLYRETGIGLFQDDAVEAGIGNVTLQTLAFGACFLDADNNAVTDIALVNGHVQDDIAMFQTNREFKQRPMLFIGRGDGTYDEIGPQIGGPYARKYVARGMAWGDYDGDGRVDLLVNVNNDAAMLLHNSTHNDNHWLAVRLRGTKSNRDGIGAMVTVTCGTKRQRAMIRSGSSYLAASELAARFGLGAAATVDSLQVRWPSGLVQHLARLPVDRTITVTEQ